MQKLKKIEVLQRQENGHKRAIFKRNLFHNAVSEFTKFYVHTCKKESILEF